VCLYTFQTRIFCVFLNSVFPVIYRTAYGYVASERFFSPAAPVTCAFPAYGVLLAGKSEVSSPLSTGSPNCSHSLAMDWKKPAEQLDLFISNKLSFSGLFFL